MRTRRRVSWQMLPALTFAYMVATSAPAQAQALKPIPASAHVKHYAVRLPAGDKFKTVAAATTHCLGDTVVWSSLSSKAFHLSASKLFGTTKHGAYVCEKDALAAGFHSAKS